MSWLPTKTLTLANVAYNATPDITIGFEPSEIVFTNLSTDNANTILVSFDGIEDHIELIKLTPLESFRAGTRQQKMWFRRGVFAAGTTVVNVVVNSYV